MSPSSIDRNLLAKGFGLPIEDHAAIADRLQEVGVQTPGDASILRKMARYRKRMVHFYDEITAAELHGIVTRAPRRLTRTFATVTGWLARYPERVQGSE